MLGLPCIVIISPLCYISFCSTLSAKNQLQRQRFNYLKVIAICFPQFPTLHSGQFLQQLQQNINMDLTCHYIARNKQTDEHFSIHFTKSSKLLDLIVQETAKLAALFPQR